jgi:hypothetical protein
MAICIRSFTWFGQRIGLVEIGNDERQRLAEPGLSARSSGLLFGNATHAERSDDTRLPDPTRRRHLTAEQGGFKCVSYSEFRRYVVVFVPGRQEARRISRRRRTKRG